MLSKKDITRDWLPRYTGTEIGEFGDYILLTNFDNYVTKFSERFEMPIRGEGGPETDPPAGKRERERQGQGQGDGWGILSCLVYVC